MEFTFSNFAYDIVPFNTILIFAIHKLYKLCKLLYKFILIYILKTTPIIIIRSQICTNILFRVFTKYLLSRGHHKLKPNLGKKYCLPTHTVTIHHKPQIAVYMIIV